MSLFKRPAWAAKQQSPDEADDHSETNIFSHSHSYRDIVAEQEQRKKEKADRKKAKAERRVSGKREVKDERNGNSTPKRRRITSEEGNRLLESVGLSTEITLDENDDNELQENGTPARRLPRKQRKNEAQDGAVRAPRPADVVDLGGSSDEEDNNRLQSTPVATRTKPKPAAPVEEIRDDSDDEFAELARKARLQRQQSQNRASNTPQPNATSPGTGVGTLHNTSHDRPPDPTIQLLITSQLPGTNPLIVHRKLSQPTGAIRLAWCQKQGFSPEFTETVFFTHRLRRVYDVTTCRSLGLDVDGFGNVVMRGAEDKEGVDKVHLEAVTEELFKQLKEAKDRDAQVRSGDLPAQYEEDEAPAPQEEESIIRLVLKAKGQKDFRLKVKPSTSISKIAAAYAKSVLNDSSREVRLEFDGESLDPEDIVQNTEIEDMDNLEVHMI